MGQAVCLQQLGRVRDALAVSEAIERLGLWDESATYLHALLLAQVSRRPGPPHASGVRTSNRVGMG